MLMVNPVMSVVFKKKRNDFYLNYYYYTTISLLFHSLVDGAVCGLKLTVISAKFC